MADLPRLSANELNVLRQLVVAEKYGIELVEGSNGQLSRASVYVLLGRMEDKNLIKGRKVDTPAGEQGPPRRIYKVTGLGERAVRAYEAAALAFSGKWSPA
jgi:DNA-binding PadR family transcriptional regulator